ncbi:MAG: response regulator [Nitrospirota bacterium]
MTSEPRPVTILLVEDNLQDIEITRRAFAKGRVRNDLVVVRDGEEALDYLRRRGKYHDPAASPRPGMILLDLNLPKVGGLDVLREIKDDPSLKAIPVIVLTVSQREQDIVRSYHLGVNTYIQKPVEFENFMRVVTTVHEYWILIATLPPAAVAE